MRSLLVVMEIALALVLLVGAGLLIRTFWELQRVDPGFNRENVLAVRIDLPSSKYAEEYQRLAFFSQLVERLAALPGVEAVGTTGALPFLNDYVTSFRVEGRPEPPPGEVPSTNYYNVSSDYFEAMGIPLLRGRGFTDRDRLGAPPVAVVNETMARRFFPDEDPIGRRIQLGMGSDSFGEIVGIVGDVKHYGLDTDAPPQTYEPSLQRPFPTMTVVIRTEGNAEGLEGMIAAVRREVLSGDRDQPLSRVATFEELLADSVVRERASMRLLMIFGAVALLLAAVGIYGVVAYSVAQRTREFGIRMAFGASVGTVLRLVVGQSVTLALSGVAVGVAASFAVTRAMTGLLFGVTPTDSTTFTIVPLVLVAVSSLAGFVPALRATRVDPLVALREE
jgi:putative ABC transport system permease protein